MQLFSLLAVLIALQLHHGLFLACLDSADLQDVMLRMQAWTLGDGSGVGGASGNCSSFGSVVFC